MFSFFAQLKKAWKTISSSKESFFIIFFFGLLVNTIVLIFQYSLFYGFDLNTKEGVQMFLSEAFGDVHGIGKIAAYGIFVFIIPVLYNYFQKTTLTQLNKGKKITVQNFFSEGNGFFPMIGTSICSGLYAAKYLIPVFILWIIIYAGAGYFVQNEIIVKSVLILGTISWFMVIVWIEVLLIFVMPMFYVDDKRYFSAVQAARGIVAGRWWKTFGSLASGFIICFFPGFLFGLIVKYFGSFDIYGINFVTSILASAINIFATMLYFVFLLNLYTEHKKHPVK